MKKDFFLNCEVRYLRKEDENKLIKKLDEMTSDTSICLDDIGKMIKKIHIELSETKKKLKKEIAELKKKINNLEKKLELIDEQSIISEISSKFDNKLTNLEVKIETIRGIVQTTLLEKKILSEESKTDEISSVYEDLLPLEDLSLEIEDLNETDQNTNQTTSIKPSNRKKKTDSEKKELLKALKKIESL